MSKDLKTYFWWLGMEGDAGDFVVQCLVCQQVKAECQFPIEKLQSLPIPVWKQENIAIGFIVGLLPLQAGHDAVWVYKLFVIGFAAVSKL